MIFDGHGDILTHLCMKRKEGEQDVFKKHHLESYKKGGITHSIFVNYTNHALPNAIEIFDEINEVALDEIEKSSDILMICKEYKDLEIAYSSGKIAVILGLEGLSGLSDINKLKELYEKGFRHASLTWNETNKYATGCHDDRTGLTELGREIIKYMEENNMIIDIAHANKKSFMEVIDMVNVPVIFSHGNVKAVHDVKRNIDDEQLLALKENGGLIGIAAPPLFIDKDPENHDVKHLVNHIDHIRDTIGVDYIGFGFDFCYYLIEGQTYNKMKDLKYISDVGLIIEELQKRGYSEDDIEKIKYKNFFRVLSKVLK